MGLPGVIGRHEGIVVFASHRLSGAHLCGPLGPRAHQIPDLARLRDGQVEGGEVQPVLLGGRDARLVLPVELDRLIRFRKLPGRQGSACTQRHPRTEGARERQGAAATDLLAEK